MTLFELKYVGWKTSKEIGASLTVCLLILHMYMSLQCISYNSYYDSLDNYALHVLFCYVKHSPSWLIFKMGCKNTVIVQCEIKIPSHSNMPILGLPIYSLKTFSNATFWGKILCTNPQVLILSEKSKIQKLYSFMNILHALPKTFCFHSYLLFAVTHVFAISSEKV